MGCALGTQHTSTVAAGGVAVGEGWHSYCAVGRAEAAHQWCLRVARPNLMWQCWQCWASSQAGSTETWSGDGEDGV